MMEPSAGGAWNWENFQKNIPSQNLFDGKSWRSSPLPFKLSPSHHLILQDLGVALVDFLKACNLLYRQSFLGKKPLWISQLLDQGKPEALIALSRLSSLKNHIPQVIRPDLIMTEEGFVLCEIDSIPGGIGLTAWLQETYSKYGFQLLGGDFGMRLGFQSIFPEGDVLISEEAMDYRPEFEWLVGADRVKNIQEESFSGHSFYRFFESFDWDKIPRLSELIESSTSMTPVIKPYLEEKILLALLRVKPLQEFWKRELGEKTLTLLYQVIPETWFLNPEPLPPYAVIPGLEIQDWNDLKKLSQKERELIMKVSGFSSLAWGSRGVWIGSDLSSEEWSRVVDESLSSFSTAPRILQRFVKGALRDHPYWDEKGTVISMKSRARISPYYFYQSETTALGGVLATLCPPDKKRIHGMKEAIMTPVEAAE